MLIAELHSIAYTPTTVTPYIFFLFFRYDALVTSWWNNFEYIPAIISLHHYSGNANFDSFI